MSSEPLRLAIANDYEIVVAGIAAVLSAFKDRVEVVELDSRVPVRSEVDLVLYDSFGQPQGGSIEMDELLAGSEAKLVVFSWNTQRDLVQASLEAGAAGYVSKNASGAALVDALERIAAGEVVVPEDDGDEDTEPAIGRYPGTEHGLSAREAEILALICQGLSNEQVAQRAFLGSNTVKTYIRNLYQKIGAESRTQAVLWGVDHGFRPDRTRRTGDQVPG